MNNKINVMVIAVNNDDQNIILQAIQDQDEIKISGVEKDEASTVIKCEKTKPDILIIGFELNVMDAVELAPIIHRRSPSTSIIMISNKDDSEYALMAFKAGISGFLLKDIDLNKLTCVIKIINLGGYYFSASITKRVLDVIAISTLLSGIKIEKLRCDFEKPDRNFSYIEHSILIAVAQGLSDEEIAMRINLSVGTIRNYQTAIKRKVKIKNRVQLVHFSLWYWLASDPGDPGSSESGKIEPKKI